MSEVRDWLQGIVAGVDYLHDRGLIHRDLKPANIYRENGVVKVGDVGLSKRFDGERRNQHTESIGTVYYMAPEITHGKYGPAVDVYSLGIILYELVTGRLPFNGETSGEILMKQLSSAPDLSIIDARLRPVIARALEKDPQKRTPSARQFWTEFDNALGDPTEIPDSHFVNGHAVRRTDAAQHNTDRPRDTGRQKPADKPVGGIAYEAGRLVGAIVHDPPGAPSRSAQPQLGIMWLVLAVVVLGSLFGPWKTWAEVAGWVICVGGITLLIQRSRNHRSSEVKLPPANRTSDFAPVPVSSDWPGVLAHGALAAACFAAASMFVPLLIFQKVEWDLFQSPEQQVFFVAVAVLGTWIALAGRWLSQRSPWAVLHPRLFYAGCGLVLATLAFYLDHYLMTTVGLDRRNFDRALFDHVGAHPLAEANEPMWLGYVVFFSGLFGLLGKRLIKIQDIGRPQRWRWWHPIVAALSAWLWVHLFVFPQTTGILWAAAIVSATQLAAPWRPPAIPSTKRSA